jgi:hypothetical protein
MPCNPSLADLPQADTGQLLCRNVPEYGQSDQPQDEAGYVVAIPPCVWGHGEGLNPPPVLFAETRLVGLSRKGGRGCWSVRRTGGGSWDDHDPVVVVVVGRDDHGRGGGAYDLKCLKF